MNRRLSRLLGGALVLGAAVVLAYHLALAGRAVGLEEPMGYPETVSAAVAKAWPDQYRAGHFLDAQDNYGPGYAGWCRPFMALGLDAYRAARLASLAALLATVAIVARRLVCYGCQGPVVAAVAAIFFALNAGSASIEARPDFLATLLIVLALEAGRPQLLERLPFWGAAMLLGALGLAGYFTKPYCVLAWGAAVSFQLLAAGSGGRRLRAVALGAASGLLIAAGVFAYAQANLYYWTETFGFHLAYAELRLSALGIQARDFAELAAGLLALAVFGLMRGLRPLAAVAAADGAYWLWSLLLGAAALLAGLGWHDGAYLVYFLHLLLPPLAIVAGLGAALLPEWLTAVALLANCWILMLLAPALPRVDPGWEALAADLGRERGRVVVDFLLEPLARGRPNVLVAGNGIVRFAVETPARQGNGTPALRAAGAEVGQFLAREAETVRNGPFPDAIYLDCTLVPQLKDGRVARYLAVPRNQHPDLLVGYDMSRYRATGFYPLHPYFVAQNGRRQDAGQWTVTIYRFERVPAEAPPAAVPIEILKPSAGPAHPG